jgi:hypothetical protein
MKKKLFDIWDIISSYIQYILLHKWNKLNYRHIRFIEEANWVANNNIKRRLLKKIKSRNKYSDNLDFYRSNKICEKHNLILGKNKYCPKCSENNNI